MRTIIIYDNVGVEPIQFAVLDGDYGRLNRVYINSSDNEQSLQDELTNLLYDKNGKKKLAMTEEFPDMRPGDKVIVAGFLP